MLDYQEQFLDSVLEMCDNLSSITDLDKLTASFVNNVAGIFNVNKVSFMLLDEIKGELSIKAFQGLDAGVTQPAVKLGESFSGRVAQEGKPLLVKDIKTEFPDLARNRLRHYSSNSFVIVPVKAQDKTIGVINLTDRKDRSPFSEDDLKALNLISRYFALHIENSRLLEKSKQLSILDPLTNLFNHSYFHGQLLEEIYRSERYRRPLSIAILDIDKFSEYNKIHGYTAGDNVLRQVGRLIKENLRQTDVPSRYGPDEFSIILPETKLKEAAFVGEKIKDKIGSAIFTDAEGRKASLGIDRLTASVGIAEHSSGLTEEELNRHAATMLLEAQQKGGNRVCVFK